MNLNTELALAARWFRAKAERLPPEHRPDVAREWAELMQRVDECRSEGSGVLAIVEWRAEMRERLSLADVGGNE